jgi:hypothetical protein
LIDGDLRAFLAGLVDEDIELSPEAFSAAVRFIEFNLEREIALQAWGASGEFRRLLVGDRALQRAILLLDEAAATPALLSLASDPGYSDWVPVVDLSSEPEEGAIGAGS